MSKKTVQVRNAAVKAVLQAERKAHKAELDRLESRRQSAVNIVTARAVAAEERCNILASILVTKAAEKIAEKADEISNDLFGHASGRAGGIDDIVKNILHKALHDVVETFGNKK